MARPAAQRAAIARELCDAQIPVHVTRCTSDTRELVLADPEPPFGFAPCEWPGAGRSRLVRWQRE